HVGLSNVTVEQLETATEIVDIATVQNQYNVGHRDDEDVLGACERNDVGFIPWGPMYAVDDEDAGEVLDEVADRRDATTRQVALAWLLDHSDVTLPIPGTSSVDHLESNLAAADLSLTDEDRAALNGVDPQE
ncbi:oxidoreductase, partial [Halorubrum sp. E3]